MRRRHLFEIHDQPQCPAAVRDGATDCLSLFAQVGRQSRAAARPLAAALAATDDRYIIDLCAGSGGPWIDLYDEIAAVAPPPIIVLTDLFPNLTAMERARRLTGGRIQSVFKPIDATAVPTDLPGLRTLFTAFHHFDPENAAAILQDAVDAGQAIAIFEQTERSLRALCFMVLLAPLAWLATPLIRPFRWSRLFWTYLIPAIPLVLLFDGIVSCLRTYSTEDLQAMVNSLDDAHYEWVYGRSRTRFSPLGMVYLIGVPSDREERTGPRVALVK